VSRLTSKKFIVSFFTGRRTARKRGMPWRFHVPDTYWRRRTTFIFSFYWHHHSTHQASTCYSDRTSLRRTGDKFAVFDQRLSPGAFASNLEQAVCAGQLSLLSLSSARREMSSSSWVTMWRPGVPDWSGGMSVRCTEGPITVRYRRHNVPRYHQRMPISCPYRDCKALPYWVYSCKQHYSKYSFLLLARYVPNVVKRSIWDQCKKKYILTTDRPTSSHLKNFKWPYLREGSSDPLHVLVLRWGFQGRRIEWR